MNSPAVIMHGGLGNQLFQWAFGHYLFKIGYSPVFLFIKKKYEEPHAQISLEEFLPSCAHGTFKKMEFSSKATELFFDPTSTKNLRKYTRKYLIESLSSPSQYLFQSYDANFFYGYYQTKDLILEMNEVILRELLDAIDVREVSDVEKSLRGKTIVHVRHGDTLKPQNRNAVGVLSADYYQAVRSKTKEDLFVVTDDVNSAKETLSKIRVKEYFGPDSLNAHQAFSVMARSSTLFTANSTLSWWAGVVAAQTSQAKVFVPNPFFKDSLLHSKHAFKFPNFQLLDSNFLTFL